MFERQGYLYTVLFIALIYVFCYFWTAIIFNPKDMANNLKDYGSFIPGYRPGKRTADYLERVLMRITYVGAAFLAVIAILPTIISDKLEVDPQIAAFYGAHFFSYDGTQTISQDMRDRVQSDMWKKYVCAPVERRPALLVIAVDDPQDLTRLDGIRAMNLAPRYDFMVGMKHEILAYIAASYGEKVDVSQSESDLAKIIEMLGEGDAQIEEEEVKEGPAEIDETDSGIVRLVNQLIIEAYNRGASDIHVEPDGAKNPCQIRLRIDGEATRSGGELRHFVSPPLRPGKTYHYVLEAELPHEGTTLTAKREVAVRAGQQSAVSLTFPEFQVGSR